MLMFYFKMDLFDFVALAEVKKKNPKKVHAYLIEATPVEGGEVVRNYGEGPDFDKGVEDAITLFFSKYPKGYYEELKTIGPSTTRKAWDYVRTPISGEELIRFEEIFEEIKAHKKIDHSTRLFS